MLRILAVLVSSIAVLVCFSATADTPGRPYSYIVPTADSQYFLAMLPRSMKSREAASKWFVILGDTEKERIQKPLTLSGLYRDDGSVNPVWAIDWYAFGVQPLSDGIHMVRPGQWAIPPDSEAVAFFANGKLIRSYSVGQLVDNLRDMPHSVSHFTWRFFENLNDRDKRYTIVTKEKKHYVFDVTTGEIIFSGEAPGVVMPSGVLFWGVMQPIYTGVYAPRELTIIDRIKFEESRSNTNSLFAVGIMTLGCLFWLRRRMSIKSNRNATQS